MNRDVILRTAYTAKVLLLVNTYLWLAPLRIGAGRHCAGAAACACPNLGGCGPGGRSHWVMPMVPSLRWLT